MSAGKTFATLPKLAVHLLQTRLVNIMSHGNYSLYEPREMNEENKEHFRTILKNFTTSFPFNPKLFAEELDEA